MEKSRGKIRGQRCDRYGEKARPWHFTGELPVLSEKPRPEKQADGAAACFETVEDLKMQHG
jgi:hypothetical protein